MNLKEKLNALKQVREKALKGPWSCDDSGDVYSSELSQTPDEGLHKVAGTSAFYSIENAEAQFIATAANEWTSLIEALEESLKCLEYYSKNGGDATDYEWNGTSDVPGLTARLALIKIDTLLSKGEK